MSFVLMVFIGAGVCCSHARADILYLTNGRFIEGKVEKVEGGYRIKTKAGRSFIPESRVERWEKKLLPKEEYIQRKAEIDQGNFDQQMALGLWCKENDLRDEARWHFMLAVAIRPNDGKARSLAGYVRRDKGWITYDEFMRSKGMVQFRGKWTHVAQAEKMKLSMETASRKREVYDEGWKILLRVSRSREKQDLNAIAEKLVAMGTDVFSVLKRGANDSSRTMRRLVVYSLSRMSGSRSRRLLLRRLRCERSTEVTRLVCHAFSWRSDRERVIEALLSLAVNHESRQIRKRALVALRAVGDTRIIDTFIPQVAYCPVPDAEEEGTAKRGVSTSETISYNGKDYNKGSDRRPRKKYYPVHEALMELTGQLLPRKPEPWNNWWAYYKDRFEFKPVLGKFSRPDEEEDEQSGDEPAEGLDIDNGSEDDANQDGIKSSPFSVPPPALLPPMVTGQGQSVVPPPVVTGVGVDDQRVGRSLSGGDRQAGISGQPLVPPMIPPTTAPVASHGSVISGAGAHINTTGGTVESSSDAAGETDNVVPPPVNPLGL